MKFGISHGYLAIFIIIYNLQIYYKQYFEFKEELISVSITD